MYIILVLFLGKKENIPIEKGKCCWLRKGSFECRKRGWKMRLKTGINRRCFEWIVICWDGNEFHYFIMLLHF